MRKVVAYENKLYDNGKIIAPGALYVRDIKIPVAFGAFTTREAIVGFATDFDRNSDTGGISFDIHPTDQFMWMDLENAEAYVFCLPFTSTKIEKNGGLATLYTTGLIREIRLTISGANPKVWLN